MNLTTKFKRIKFGEDLIRYHHLNLKYFIYYYTFFLNLPVFFVLLLANCIMFLNTTRTISSILKTSVYRANPVFDINARVSSRFYSAITSKCEITTLGEESLNVKWTNEPNVSSTYSYLWLRDNCPCPQCVHPSSRQKLHSSADVPLDIEPTDVKITGDEAEIIWNQSLRHGKDTNKHVSRFPLEFLQRYQSKSSSEKFRLNHVRPQTWRADEYKLDWVSYGEYMTTDEGLHTVAQRLYNTGLVFLKDVPLKDESVTKVAERIGPVQETFYGRDFDVKNIAKSINIAYTSLYLGFHMDLM